MNTAPPLVDRFKSWSTVKKLFERDLDWQQTHQESHLQRLRDYIDNGRIAYISLLTGLEEIESQPSRSTFLGNALTIAAMGKVVDGYQLAQADEARELFAQAVQYREISSFQALLIEAEFPACFGRKLRGCSIDVAGWVGLAAASGALDVMERWAPLLVDAVRSGYMRDDDSRGLQHWILRVWCAARGIDYPDTGYPRYEVAEGVLQMWNTPDIDMLGAWLVQLCNQHSRLTGSRDFMDFANTFSHFPVEVLMLFRLREQIGLTNPEVDHPMMKFPWSRLWPVKPSQPDELLAGVYWRLESDEGVTLEGLYRQLSAV